MCEIGVLYDVSLAPPLSNDTIIFDFSDGGEYGYRLGLSPDDLVKQPVTTKEIFFPYSLNGKGYFDFWNHNLKGRQIVLGCPMRNLTVHMIVTARLSSGLDVEVFESMKQWLHQSDIKKAIFLCSRVPTDLHKEIIKIGNKVASL